MDMWCSVESLVYGTPHRHRHAPNVARPRNGYCQKGNQLTAGFIQRPMSRSVSACQPTSRPSAWQHLHTGTGNPRHPGCPTTNWLIMRAREEWDRSLCKNQAFAILHRMQTGRSALIKKDGGEMLVAIALDRPLADAQALVSDPQKLIEIILKIIRDGFHALFFLQKKLLLLYRKIMPMKALLVCDGSCLRLIFVR